MQAVLDQALAGVETANFDFHLITKSGAQTEFFEMPRQG